MPTDIEQRLNLLDWRTYEDRVVLAFQEAVNEYRRRCPAPCAELVSQISITTNPQSCETDISFETSPNAQEKLRRQVEQIYAQGLKDVAERAEAFGYQYNPAEFKFVDFYTITHPELAGLMELNYRDNSQEQAADARIESSLLRVVERILQEQRLQDLPTEPEVWIGVSSPRDWYDHVRKIVI